MDVTGMCEKCLDYFDLVLEKTHRGYLLESTTVATQREDSIYHRPGICGGRVRLLGAEDDHG